MMGWYTFLIVMHIIGTALGAGGATISDLSFFRSVRDGKVDRSELDLLKTISTAIWAGFGILVFSGFGFFLLYRIQSPELGLIYNPKLFAKLTIVLVIFFNGLIMHAKVFPLLGSFVGRPLFNSDFAKRATIAFTTGAISIISWYSALILGAWRGLDWSYGTIMGIYIALVAAGIIFANIVGRQVIKKLGANQL